MADNELQRNRGKTVKAEKSKAYNILKQQKKSRLFWERD